MKKLVFILLLLLVVSCEKDDGKRLKPNPIPPEEFDNALMIEVQPFLAGCVALALIAFGYYLRDLLARKDCTANELKEIRKKVGEYKEETGISILEKIE